MTSTCPRAAEAFRRDDPPAIDRLRVHAARCEECARALALWDAISSEAPGLRRSWDSPALFARIAAAIEAEKSRPAPSRDRPEDASASRGRFRWVPLAAAATLFVVAMAGLQVFRNSGGREPLANASGPNPLLTEGSLADVESAEANYVRSIEKLSSLARPRIENPTTPLFVNYREKLLLLDSAIAEMRTQIQSNQFNSHLRKELLAMYQEKQRTLQELMKEATS